MFDKAQIESMTADIEKQLKTILGKTAPLQNTVNDLLNNYSPTETRYIDINGEQVVVSILKGNRALFTFKDTACENAFLYSLTKKRGKFANLLYAIKCLFS